MLNHIIDFSIKNKLIIILVTLSVTGFGVYSILQIPLGAVPDITNNQVQVITTDPDSKTVMCFAQMTGAEQSALINNI